MPQPYEYARLPDNTPVIVGAAQLVERIPEHTSAATAPALTAPLQLAAHASGSALHDAGIAAQDVDTIAVIRLFSDTGKAWASPFGGSNNAPESIAQRIGASPTARIYSDVGGTQPLELLTELLQDIAQGRTTVALLAGAEAIANQRFAVRHNIELDWRETYSRPLDNRKYRNRYASAEEVSSGLHMPAHFYALIENLQVKQLGHTRQQHTEYMARLLAPFSTVAANNPYAQFPNIRTIEELADAGPHNYPISLPYTKRLIAHDSVNQAAALVLTSAGNARRLKIDPSQWVFLESYADGVDQYLSLREDPAHSVAMERVLQSVLASAECTARDMDMIDIYSCFPCAIHAACKVLNLPTDGSRPLTVTGGLPFFGGPGNNYSLHALAEVAVRLRREGTRGLITANGGMMSKHAALVLGNDPERATRIDWGADSALTVDCSDIPIRPVCAVPQEGRIVSYTLIARRNAADLGVVLAETPAGERFVAVSAATDVAAELSLGSPIGRQIRMHAAAGQVEFSFAAA